MMSQKSTENLRKTLTAERKHIFFYFFLQRSKILTNFAAD